MKTLDRYIGANIVRGYLLVLALLLALFSFVSLLEQLEDVGDHNYDMLDAILYVLLTMPDRMLTLAPVTALLGSLAALALLARNNELTAMKAAGISVLRLGWSVMRPAIAFMLVVLVVTEFVAPPLYQFAAKHRLQEASKFDGEVLRGKGFWARQEYQVVNVRRLSMGRLPADIDIFEFDPDGRLIRYIHAERADVAEDGVWQLRDVRVKSLDGRRVRVSEAADLPWRPFWDNDPFATQIYPVASLSLAEIGTYIEYLQEVGQEVAGIKLTYWRKWFQPLLVGAMALLSVSFVFGAARSSSFGRRIALGVMSGILFFLGSQLLYNLGLLFVVNPMLVAFGPVMIIGAIAVLLLRRAS